MADESADRTDNWRFDVEEVGEDAEPLGDPIEPESVELENAVFVLLGVVGTAGLIVTAAL